MKVIDREAVASLLASGLTQQATADRLHISRKTVNVLFQEESFRIVLQKKLQEIHATTNAKLATSGVKAAEAMDKLLGKKKVTKADDLRLKAAARILEFALRFNQQVDTDERLRRLEEKNGISQPDQGTGETGSQKREPSEVESEDESD